MYSTVQLNPPVSNHVTMELHWRLHGHPMWEITLDLSCVNPFAHTIETFNSLATFIPGSHWYGCFNFANRIFFVSKHDQYILAPDHISETVVFCVFLPTSILQHMLNYSASYKHSSNYSLTTPSSFFDANNCADTLCYNNPKHIILIVS